MGIYMYGRLPAVKAKTWGHYVSRGMWKRVTDKTETIMPMLITKRPNKDQRLQDIIEGNNYGRHFHRVW